MMSILTIIAISLVYGLGVRASWKRAGVGRGIRAWQVWCFGAGIAVLVLALASPIDERAEELFSAHMLQHVLLAVVAPPFLVAGAPMVAALWALPTPWRGRTTRAIKNQQWLVGMWTLATTPAIACAVHAIAIWSWHVPSAYDAALRHPLFHVAEHASFVGSASLLWWGILNPRKSRRAAYGVGVLVLFITMMQSGALGALLTLSKRVWFPIHAAGEAALNVLPIDDQQLAGLIMWVVGSLLYLAAMSILLFAWLRQNERHRRAAALVILAAFATSGCRRAEGSVIPGGSINRGRQSLVVMGCGNCHEIAGVLGAHGRVGPPLTGIASRSIIAGHLPNTPENMMRWIMDPPSVDSLTAMPNLGVAEQTARDISAYLYTLR